MENTRFNLRINDFKKMVRFMVSYVIINLAAFIILIFLIEDGYLNKRTFPLEVVLIIFFVVFTGGFLLIQKRNTANEEVTADSMGVHTNRFGSIMFSDITAYQVFKKKRSEAIILILRDGRKMMFGPVHFRKSIDKKIYQEFKTFIAEKIPQKKYAS